MTPDEHDRLRDFLIERDLPHGITRAVRATLDKHSETAASFISGSLVEGYGNSQSDIDLFLLSELTAGTLTESSMMVNQGIGIDIEWDDQVRVDTEHWSLDDAVTAVKKIAALDFSHGEHYFAQVRDIELQFLHRILVGVPVTGAETVLDIRDRIDQRRLSLINATRFLSQWNSLTSDAVGATEDGQWGTAMLQSRASLGAAMDALMAARGSTNNKLKWRFVKMLDWCSEAERNDYLAAELEPAPDEASILVHAGRRIRRAQQISQRAQELVGEAIAELAR
jgi:hypothetical protein